MTIINGDSRQLANEEKIIKVRLDVDYPYPSRAKSFLFLAFRVKRKSRNYLKNSKIIARMFNESPKKTMAYWFFTPYTIPDQKLLTMLIPERHEVGLHVAVDPYQEWKILENQTQQIVRYYTIHGTSRVMAQLLWGRKIGQKKAKIPSDFPLKSFHDFNTYSLDVGRYKFGLEAMKVETEKLIKENVVLEVHPEWLFSKGTINPRGPYYDILKYILDVDHELETLKTKKKLSIKIASDYQEFEKNIAPINAFVEKLFERDIDIFTFVERKWCCSTPYIDSTWIKEDDNVGLIEIKYYSTWWSSVSKKTRNMVRRAEKSGINVAVVEPSTKFAEGVWKIYNETPIRQERAFSHYGESLEAVIGNVTAARKDTFIGAFLQDELVGFIQIVYGDRIAIIAQILSFQKHWDKAVNNALLAKAVEVCASKGEQWLMYGRIGNHPSLDKFKESNGFTKFPITRYYVPITWKGKIAIRLGLHKDIKDALPESIKYPLIPVTNWASRNKMRMKLRLK
jgi:hypothetical protein